MTRRPDLPANGSPDPEEPLTAAQQEALHEAVAKIIALGTQVGVGADEMIGLLKSGLSVGELLDYLNSRRGEIA